MKKIISLVMAVLMIFGTFAFTATASFDDVPVDNEALYDAVELLDTLGVAKGTTVDTFSPDDLVSRQQMAAFVYRLMKAGRSSEGGVNTTSFIDLEDPTYFNMVSWANTSGVIKGISATEFNPKGQITLQDAYTMVVRALGYEKIEDIAYPYGYIDIAEDIGLDEGLLASVDYTDALTRGDVAIILANAFYADMAEKTTEYEWVVNESTGNAAYVPVEISETVAHKIFGVEEESLMIVGTTHYGFDGIEPTYNELNDVELVIATNGTETIEYEFDDFNLPGSADDYFLAELTVFVKGEGKDEEILAAKSNLVKKTVTAEDVVIDRSTKKDKEYYVDVDKTEKIMTGLINFDGIKTYLDASQAPYSVTKDTDYSPVNFIMLVNGNYNEENATYDYVNANVEFKYNTANPVALTNDFANNAVTNVIYNEGLYEADVYDSDNDGYADFIFVKDYSFGQIVDKKNYTTFDGVAKKDYTIIGDYESEDYVLAYVNDDAKIIEVKEVIAAADLKAVSKTKSDDSIKVMFDDGTEVELNNKKYDSDYDFTPGKIYTVYVKDDIVLYSPDARTYDDFDSKGNYVIIRPFDDGDIIYTEKAIVNDSRETVNYVNVIIDGKSKTVKIADKVYDGNDAIKMSADVLNDGFVNKFSTYTINADGEYVFTKLAFADIEALEDKEEESATYVEIDSINVEHHYGSIYSIDGYDYRFNMKDYSKVIIKSYDDDDEEVFTIYTSKTLPKFDTTTFNNVKAIVINNPKSNVENVGVIYAEVDEFGAKVTKDYRIVIGIKEVANEDNKTVTELAVLDVMTGKTSSKVLLAGDGTPAVGDYVIINSDGKAEVTETANTYTENVIFTDNVITEYDVENNFLSIGDEYTYILDDTMIIFYEGKDKFEINVDEDMLVADNWEEDETYKIDIIAVDDEDKDDIKLVKVIIIK